jgi:phage-related protein
MEPLFEILFLEDAFNGLQELNRKHAEKIIYNARRAQVELNSALFKKLTGDIWEFRTLYQGKQYRLLAFWDKSKPDAILVVATHAFVKKESKVPSKEIDRAMMLRRKYFIEK